MRSVNKNSVNCLSDVGKVTADWTKRFVFSLFSIVRGTLRKQLILAGQIYELLPVFALLIQNLEANLIDITPA
jgi:hypothetical protein